MLKFQNVAKLKIYNLFLMLLFLSCREKEITFYEDNSVPQIPMGFKVYGAFDGQIGLEWIPNNSTDRYLIYRSVSDSLNFSLIKTTSDKFYLDTKLEYELTYFYKLKAINKDYKESGFTKIVFAKPENIYTPTRPIIESVIPKNTNGELSINLKWTQLFDTDISYYEIFRDTSEFFYNMDEVYKKTNSTFFEDKTNLKVLQNFYYRIKAVDKGGLKSQATLAVTAKILDLPKQVYPSNNGIINKLNEIKFITCSLPAVYKITIFEYNTDILVFETSLNTNKIKEEVSLPMNLNLNIGKKYKWRIIAFLPNSNEPNSITDFYNFTLIQ